MGSVQKTQASNTVVSKLPAHFHFKEFWHYNFWIYDTNKYIIYI